MTLAQQPTLRDPARTVERVAPRVEPTAPPSAGGMRTPAAWATAVLLLWLLVGPRYDLPFSFDLRVEDLVFVALGVICAGHVRRVRLPFDIAAAIAAVVGTGLLSAAVATARGMVTPLNAVLFAVRPLEYWIAFPAALLLLRSADGAWLRRVDPLLAVVTVLQTGFAVAQYYFGLQVGFSHASYARAAGLTVGPYELGAMTAALAVYWVARGRWVMASMAAIALAASISRISILGAGIALVVLAGGFVLVRLRQARRDGWRAVLRPRIPGWRIAVQLAAVAFTTLVLAFTLGIVKLPELPVQPAPAASADPGTGSASTGAATTAATPTPSAPASSGAQPDAASPVLPSAPHESVATRIQSTSVLGSWEVAGALASRVDPPKTAEEYQSVAYARLNEHINTSSAAEYGAEPSNLVRFFRWHLLLDTVNDPADVVFGLGPSFVGPSVDGSYLRMFADGGILGVLAWSALIITWLRRGPLWMRCATITMLVGGTFIDILYSQRPMVLFWVLLALAVALAERAGRSVDPAPRSGGPVPSSR